MPTLRACATLLVYWLVWLTVVNRFAASAFHSGSYVAAIGWLVGTSLLAAWFTWVELVDDAKRKKYGDDDEGEDAPAHPAIRFLGAVMFTMGAMGSFALAAVLPLRRTHLIVAGIGALVLAVVTLFFARRGSDDFDID
jgi:hypothetical protein